MICYRENLKKAGCKFLGVCKKAIRTDEFCNNHQPIKDEKSDRCRSCGEVFHASKSQGQQRRAKK